MIYKNPMQVKEIPIIFRGTIDGAQSGGGGGFITEPDIDITDTPWDDDGYYLIGTTADLGDPNKLYVSINGEYSEIDNKTETSPGIYCFGAQYSSDLDNYDFSEYDIAVVIFGTDIQMYFQDLTEKHIEIWTTEPEPEPSNPIPTKKIFSADLTGNGQIKSFNVRFALGENGTLRIKPYVILNGNIRVNLADFAAEGDQYIAGDNETVSFDCFVPVETHAKICVEAENTGDYASILDAWAVVQYEDYIEEESIVGYEGVNLRRRRW